MRIVRRLFVLLLLAAPVFGVYSGRIAVADAWNPWAPLKIDEPLNWLTRYKLARAGADDALCLDVLAQAQMTYVPVDDRETAPGCGFDNAVRITRSSVRVGDPFTLSCRSAVALALWERHVLQPAALARLGEPVAAIEHYGTYSCRNVYGRKDAPVSRHATADAIDIAGFVLQKGRRVRVEPEWGSADDDGIFLREIRDGACRVFDTVLGPESNAAHRNHFHFDRGGWRACR